MCDVQSVGDQGFDLIQECGGGAPEHGHEVEVRLSDAGVDGRWGDLVIVVPGEVRLWGRP